MKTLSQVRAANAPYLIGSPLALTGTVVLNPDETTSLNADAFRNMTAYPIEIRELRWAVSSRDLASDASAVYPAFSGFAVEAMMFLGGVGGMGNADCGVPITNAPVPLTLLGASEDPLWEAGALVVNGVGSAGGTFAAGCWRFDEPMLLMPGEWLNIVLHHRGITQNAITCYMTVGGNIVKKQLGAKRSLPFLAPYIAPPLTVVSGTTDVRRQSTEKDLVNASGANLRVRRITGRLAVYTTRVNGAVITNELNDVNHPEYAAQLLNVVSLRDSLGHVSVKNSMAFSALFPTPIFALECPHVVFPKGYYLVALQLTPTTNALVTQQIHPALCLIGHRDIGKAA